MTSRKKRLNSLLTSKSHMSKGFRYHDGKLLNLSLPSPESNKTYLFELLVGESQSHTVSSVLVRLVEIKLHGCRLILI